MGELKVDSIFRFTSQGYDVAVTVEEDYTKLEIMIFSESGDELLKSYTTVAKNFKFSEQEAKDKAEYLVRLYLMREG